MILEYRDLTVEELEEVGTLGGQRCCAVRYNDTAGWWLYWETNEEYESRTNAR